MDIRALCVFFTVTSNEKTFLIIEKISKIPDVISIMKTTGDYDLQIWAMVKDIGQLLSIQEEIGKISGIMRIDMEVLGFEEDGRNGLPLANIFQLFKPSAVFKLAKNN